MASTSSRRRQPLGFALFCNQPLQEVHALTQLADLLLDVSQLVDFTAQLPHVLRGFLIGSRRGLLAENPRRDRLTDRGDRKQNGAATPKDQDYSRERDDVVGIQCSLLAAVQPTV